MITFAKEVDLKNDEAVFEYLKKHPRYFLMNSWNRLKTFAQNIKIYNLDVDREVSDKLYELLDVDSPDVEFILKDNIEFFNEENPGYTIYTDGRSGGYLILASSQNDRGKLSDMTDTVNNYDTLDDLKEDYDFEEFRTLAETIMNFDRACDNIIQAVVSLAENCEIVEEEYMVLKTRKVIKCNDPEEEEW